MSENKYQVRNCINCRKETYDVICRSCTEDRQRNPRSYCQCGRSKYYDSDSCEVCWNSGY